MKKLVFIFITLLIFTCKKEQKNKTCDRNNCSNCEEITLDFFTGFQSALCQDNYDYEIVETLDNNESLCETEGDFYRFKASDYEEEKIECECGRDYYKYVKIR